MNYYDDEETVDRRSLRYVLYARKSTEDEDSQMRSIGDQIEQCKRLAEREGLHIVSIVEESKSAKSPDKRPLFTQILKDIENGKYDAILSWHPDRLSRNMLESGKIIDLLDNNIIKDLSFVTYRFTNNASGKMMLGMLFVISKQYSEDLSEKVRRGIGGNFRDGKSAGAPRWGYDRDEVSGYYNPNEHFDLIQEGWLMRAGGETIANVIKYWKVNGVVRKTKLSRKNKSIRDIYPSQTGATKMFANPFYFGILVQSGQEVDLRLPPFDKYHTPMVTKDVWDAVQALGYNRSRMKPRTTKKDVFYPFRGMVLCDVCKSSVAMRVGKVRSANGTYSLRYRCDTKGCQRSLKNVNAHFILDGLYKELERLKFTENEYEAYSKKMDEVTSDRLDEIKSEIRSLNGARSAKIRQRDDLTRKARDNMEKTSTIYKVTISDIEKLQDEIIDLEASIAKLEEKNIDPRKIKMNKEEFLNLANSAVDKMKAGSAVEKDILARKMLLNLSLNNKNAPSFIWKEPFATLLKTRKYSSGGPGWT